jgi:hypothetical protein
METDGQREMDIDGQRERRKQTDRERWRQTDRERDGDKRTKRKRATGKGVRGQESLSVGSTAFGEGATS